MLSLRPSGSASDDPRSLVLPEKFETLTQAREDKRLLVGRLKRDISYQRYSWLANRLDECSISKPCTFAACPLCRTLFRSSLIAAATSAALDEMPWVRASIIPSDMLFQDGLMDVSFVRLKQKVVRRLQRLARQFVGLTIVGGFDTSFNVVDGVDIGWQVHIYMLIRGYRSHEMETAIRKAFPPEPTADKPYSFKAVNPDDFFEVLTYSNKSRSYRRSTYDERLRKKADGSPRRNTRALRLTAAQSVELAWWHYMETLDSRLILIGMRRRGADVFNFELKITSPQSGGSRP